MGDLTRTFSVAGVGRAGEGAGWGYLAYSKTDDKTLI